MSFHFDYYYPNREQPVLFVTAIDNGYGFMLYDDAGKMLSHFSINRNIVENRHAATGYEGKEAEAIEHFRSFLFRFNK